MGLVLSVLLFSLSAFAELTDPGILPDSPFYVVDQFFEETFVNDDPEKALAYREEKIAEAQAMAEQDEAEYTEEALEHADEYADILEQEVTPELESEVEDSSVDVEEALTSILEKLPEINDEVDRHLEKDKKILLAADVAAKIKELCHTLSSLDPLLYAQTCQADEHAPAWLKKQHQELSKEQKEHAKLFASKLKQCFKTPENCDCKGMGVTSFEEICERESSREAKCRAGDAPACQESVTEFNPAKYLPDYLLPVIADMEKEMREGEEFKEGEQFLPPVCTEAGLTTREDCAKLMREKFLPEACKQAGATTPEACAEIMKNTMPEDRGRPERIEEFGRDCHALETEEKIRCFEEFYEKARGKYGEQFDQKYEEEWKQEHRGEEWKEEYRQRWEHASDEERLGTEAEARARMNQQQYDYRQEYRQGDTGYEYRQEDNGEYRQEYTEERTEDYAEHPEEIVDDSTERIGEWESTDSSGYTGETTSGSTDSSSTGSSDSGSSSSDSSGGSDSGGSNGESTSSGDSSSSGETSG